MKEKAFCTIVTHNYFPWAVTLYDSLQEFDKEITLYVAVTDRSGEDYSSAIGNKNIEVLSLDDFWEIKFSKEIIEKYNANRNIIRWALKPILMSKCLQFSEKVIFLDADLYFYNNYDFLFDYLDSSNIILTPNWKPSKPTNNKIEFETIFRHGIYNAGFVGANRKGQDVLDFWAESCLIYCDKNEDVGLFYDQTYLNLFPIYFDNVLTVKHLGCNIASWNVEVCKRTLNPETKEVTINNKFPIIFIHYSNVTTDMILRNEDPLLREHLNKFNSNLVKNGFRNVIEERFAYFERVKKEQNETAIDKLIKKLKLIYYKIRY